MKIKINKEREGRLFLLPKSSFKYMHWISKQGAKTIEKLIIEMIDLTENTRELPEV